jgi:hypothetical protein
MLTASRLGTTGSAGPSHSWSCSFEAYRQLIDACLTGRELASAVLAGEIEAFNVGALIEQWRAA